MTCAARPRPGRVSRWLGGGLALAGVCLAPWIAALAAELPASEQAYHWAAAWVGLDCLEAVTLLATGLLLLRGDRRRGVAAGRAVRGDRAARGRLSRARRPTGSPSR